MERKDEMMRAENGDAIRETATKAGAAFDTAEKEGLYFQGAVDGLLMRYEAIRNMIAGPKATA